MELEIVVNADSLEILDIHQVERELRLDRLVDAVKWAEYSDEHPSDVEIRWSQHTWGMQVLDHQENVCQTAMCVAGFGVTEAGWKMLYEKRPNPRSGVVFSAASHCVNPANGQIAWIRAVASHHFGISEPWSDVLYDEDNDITQLKIVVNGIAMEVGEPKPFPELPWLERSEFDEFYEHSQ